MPSEELGTWRLQCGQGPACSPDSELYLRGWALKPASPGQSLRPAPLLYPPPTHPPHPRQLWASLNLCFSGNGMMLSLPASWGCCGTSVNK